MGSAVSDVALGVVFGGKSLAALREYGTPSQRANIAKNQSETSLMSATTSRPYEKKVLGRALTFGGLSGGILLFRPVSRLAFYSTRLGGALGERVAGVVNRMALRQEAREKPVSQFILVGTGKAART